MFLCPKVNIVARYKLRIRKKEERKKERKKKVLRLSKIEIEIDKMPELCVIWTLNWVEKNLVHSEFLSYDSEFISHFRFIFSELNM